LVEFSLRVRKGWGFFVSVNEQLSKAAVAFDARAINTAIITLKQTACRCPTVGAAASAALGGRRAGASGGH